MKIDDVPVWLIDGCKLSSDAKYMRVRASAGASGWQECTHNTLTKIEE